MELMSIRAAFSFAPWLLLLSGSLHAADPGSPHPGSPVYLLQSACGLDLTVASAAVASVDPEALVLLDSSDATPYLRAFLTDWKPSRLVLVTAESGAGESTRTRLGRAPDTVLSPAGTGQGTLLDALFPTAAEVVVCPAEPVADLLQAACLAGVRRAPLFVLDAKGTRLAALLDALIRWKTQHVTLVGSAGKIQPWLAGWKCAHLTDSAAVQAAHLHDLAKGKPLPTIVLTNPHERLDAPETMAALAPWLALQKRAALRFTAADGADAAGVVEQALREPKLAKAEFLILAGSPRAIPPELRPNPLAADKDRQIECEPTTPRDGAVPCSLAVGRLFHPDRAIVPLMLGRQFVLAHDLQQRTPRVLVASNVGGGLPLLEMFSRATVEELRNVGWSVSGNVGSNMEEEELRRQMRRHDIFLWEGHQSTLIRDWGYPRWAETTPPQLVVLQSCLALEEAKVLPILARGAIGVVGTSTRMYSGSGGASSLAFFDALAHDNQSLGGALRQAKNFLLAYAQLKEQRLEAAARTGSNVRAAWAFTLWGDPTFRLPGNPTPDLPPITTTSASDKVTITIPTERLPALATAKYHATIPPNGRLAGLLHPAEKDKPQEMVPLVFAEVALKPASTDQQPKLTGQLPSARRVLLYDARRERGFLVLVPSGPGETVLKFRVQWESPE
jgi:hypothetical protein